MDGYEVRTLHLERTRKYSSSSCINNHNSLTGKYGQHTVNKMATNTPLFRAHPIVDDINHLGCYTYEQIANEMTSAILQQIHTFKHVDMKPTASHTFRLSTFASIHKKIRFQKSYFKIFLLSEVAQIMDRTPSGPRPLALLHLSLSNDTDLGQCLCPT